MIFSIPTKISTTASRITSEITVKPGKNNAAPETIIAKIPKPICAALFQPGSFTELIF
jgi:hypothetical protein